MSTLNCKITISLTTTPGRIESILPTLNSLLQQTRPADEILLYVPTYCARLDQHFVSIPEHLIELVKATQLRILKTEKKTTQLKILKTEDYGPATKFIPAWKSIEGSKNHFLIWLDDDILYADTLVEELVANCPEKSAISATGFNLLQNSHVIVSGHQAPADIVEGWGGVCCRVTDIPNLDKLWTIKPYNTLSFIERCYWHSDDYVISRALQDNGIKTIVCNTQKFNRRMNKPLDLGFKSDALQNSETTKGHRVAYAALEQARIEMLASKGTSL
jgi:hypothetical protein